MSWLTRQDERAVSFRWWFRPAVALLDLTVRIKPAHWQADLLAFVVKHGTKVKTRSERLP